MPPAFYQLAREAHAHGSLFLVDSIQAGLRAPVIFRRRLPGFRGLDAPDMETYSGAQRRAVYPLSVLAVTEATAAIYKREPVRQHHDHREPARSTSPARCWRSSPRNCAPTSSNAAAEALAKLEALKAELPGLITKVRAPACCSRASSRRLFKGATAPVPARWLREHTASA